MTFDDSVNNEKFKEFVSQLREKFPTDRICLYMDLLTVHRSYVVRSHLDQLNIPYVFNPPYSPDFNGIESVFWIMKNKLKRFRLKALVNGDKIDLREKVVDIFKEIDKDKIINCIDYSLNKLFNHKT